MTRFEYHPAILERFPNIVGGVILAKDLAGENEPAALAGAYRAEQQATLARLGETPLSRLESLAAWRTAFSAFGVEPTRYRSAAEALLRRLTKKGDIPLINTLVDLGNLVSIRYALPVAVFDTREVQGTVTVRFAGGDERFTPLGEETAEQPEPGEVIFADDSGQVLARRWCWRQSAGSAAGPHTRAAIVTVEAHHAGARSAIEAAVNDLRQLLQAHAAGTLQSAILDARRPAIEAGF